jgi:hypothetical protein
VKRIPVTVTGLASLRPPEPGDRWLNYRQRGIGPEDVPDLIRIATAPELLRADPDSPVARAAVHAWRALAQLKPPEALEPLLALAEQLAEEEDSFLDSEMCDVLSMFGPEALPRLTAYLGDTSKGFDARWVVADAISVFGENNPSHWEECLKILEAQLRRSAEVDRDPKMTAVVISALVESEAEELAPLIERIYEEYPVDEEIAGTWEDAAFDLGLLDEEDEDWEDEEDWEEEGWGPPPFGFPERPGERVWGDPDARSPAEGMTPSGKSPKERAQERAKARKKQKKKKKKK